MAPRAVLSGARLLLDYRLSLYGYHHFYNGDSFLALLWSSTGLRVDFCLAMACFRIVVTTVLQLVLQIVLRSFLSVSLGVPFRRSMLE